MTERGTWGAPEQDLVVHPVEEPRERGDFGDVNADRTAQATEPVAERGTFDEVAVGVGTATWAGPFTGLYRGHKLEQGDEVDVPPEQAVSGWFDSH
jgi:hypothetical protein